MMNIKNYNRSRADYIGYVHDVPLSDLDEKVYHLYQPVAKNTREKISPEFFQRVVKSKTFCITYRTGS